MKVSEDAYLTQRHGYYTFGRWTEYGWWQYPHEYTTFESARQVARLFWEDVMTRGSREEQESLVDWPYFIVRVERTEQLFIVGPFEEE